MDVQQIARFHIDSGPIRDEYELEYDWNGDTEVTWKLTKGDMVTAMDGMYRLTASGDSTTVLVSPGRRCEDSDARHDQA